MRLLIVDDSAPTRRFIQRVAELTGLNFQGIDEAANGAEALERLAENDFDLILIDVNMPVMNGEQLLTHLRRQPGYETTPVIAVSTDATVGRITRMRALGANGYITKPFTPEALRDQVERVLRRGQGDAVESPDGRTGSVEWLLRASAQQVLETMFFSAAAGDGAREPFDAGRSAWVHFDGSISGRFAIVLTPDAAANVAHNFLGLTGEQVGEPEQDQVLRELANMVCGRFLSHFEPAGRFDLGSPVSMPGHGFAALAACLNDQAPVAQAALTLDVGSASMILSLEGAAMCPVAA